MKVTNIRSPSNKRTSKHLVVEGSDTLSTSNASSKPKKEYVVYNKIYIRKGENNKHVNLQEIRKMVNDTKDSSDQ